MDSDPFFCFITVLFMLVLSVGCAIGSTALLFFMPLMYLSTAIFLASLTGIMAVLCMICARDSYLRMAEEFKKQGIEEHQKHLSCEPANSNAKTQEGNNNI